MCLRNTLYHSKIFKTITDDLGNLKLSINSNIKNLFDGSFFKQTSILSDTDIKALKAYNAEIEHGVSPMTAYYRTMQEASDSAINMAKSAGEATVNIEQIPKVSKAATVATKALAVAGNMLAMWAISAVISKIAESIDNYIHRIDNLKEAAAEAKSAIDDIKSDFDTLSSTTDDIKERFAELAQGLENLGKVNQSRGKLSTADIITALQPYTNI